jgi:carboxylesterase
LAYAELPVSCIREAFVLLAGTGDLLHRIKCPLLAVQSRVDHVVPPANGQRILSTVSSDIVRALWLDNSFHVATLDNDRQLIADSIGSFFSEGSA